MTATLTNFSFPSARRLYRYFGEMDAMVELTELVARFFLFATKQKSAYAYKAETMGANGMLDRPQSSPPATDERRYCGIG